MVVIIDDDDDVCVSRNTRADDNNSASILYTMIVGTVWTVSNSNTQQNFTDDHNTYFVKLTRDFSLKFVHVFSAFWEEDFENLKQEYGKEQNGCWWWLHPKENSQNSRTNLVDLHRKMVWSGIRDFQSDPDQSLSQLIQYTLRNRLLIPRKTILLRKLRYRKLTLFMEGVFTTFWGCF